VFLVEFPGANGLPNVLLLATYFLQTCDLFYLQGLSLFRNQAADSICGSFCARNTGNAVPWELARLRALTVVEQILLSTDALDLASRSISLDEAKV
jgi:hypothetical protein